MDKKLTSMSIEEFFDATISALPQHPLEHRNILPSSAWTPTQDEAASVRQRIVNTMCHSSNVKTVAQLCRLRRFDVKTMPNLGSMSLRVVEHMMKAQGLKFETDYDAINAAPGDPNAKKYFVLEGDNLKLISKRALVGEFLKELENKP